MAKLNGVNTLDMVNGEITKVAYGGAEYVVTEDNVQVGDLAQATISNTDITKGAFYAITEVDSDGDYSFYDDINDSAYLHPHQAEVFRKISAQTPPPTIEARVEALEADVATIKGEQTAPVIPQVDDVVTFEGFDGEYRKVDREAQAGDVVVFRENTSVSVMNSVPYLVEADCDYGDDRGLGVKGYVKVYYGSFGRTPETVDVYEKVEAEYVPQEGDIVVVTDASVSNHNVGDIGKLTEIVHVNCFRVTVPYAENNGNVLLPKRFRKATPAEVEAYEQALLTYEKALHKASFSVGDYVKIVKSDRGSEGEIVKITVVGEGLQARNVLGDVVKADFHAESLDGELCGLTADQIVKATEQEVADASQPKLNVGDTVKLIKSERGNTGDYAEIIKVGTFKANTPRGVEGMTYLVRMLTGKDASNVFAGDDSYYVKATQADVAKALAPKLKAGDFVKFKADGKDITAGKAYEIAGVTDGEYYVIDDKGRTDYRVSRGDKYEVIPTDEAKWAKIGRQPFEMKKGDVVRVKNSCGAEIEKGRVFVAEHDGDIRSVIIEGWLVSTELIAPVESTLK